MRLRGFLGRLGYAMLASYRAALLSIGLIAICLFQLVTVAAFKQGRRRMSAMSIRCWPVFQLVASRRSDCSAISTHTRPANPGMFRRRRTEMRTASILSPCFRGRPGHQLPELTQPTTPTSLAVPDSLTSAPSHSALSLYVRIHGSPQRNPWELLTKTGLIRESSLCSLPTPILRGTAAQSVHSHSLLLRTRPAARCSAGQFLGHSQLLRCVCRATLKQQHLSSVNVLIFGA